MKNIIRKLFPEITFETIQKDEIILETIDFKTFQECLKISMKRALIVEVSILNIPEKPIFTIREKYPLENIFPKRIIDKANKK